MTDSIAHAAICFNNTSRQPAWQYSSA